MGRRQYGLEVEELDEVVDRAPFEQLRGARLLITGGTGFFGRWVVATFARANQRLRLGATAVVLTRTPGKLSAYGPAVEPLEGDLRVFDAPAGLSHVVHAAAATTAVPGPLEEADVIVRGTARVVEGALRAGARMLYVSSGAVYGRQPPGLDALGEEHPGAPDPLDARSTYGESKRLAEHLCVVSGVPTVIARCFAFVGPFLPTRAHFAIGNFVGDALAGGPIVVRGDGTAVRSWLYASDLAIWLWNLLLRGAPGRAYNVGSEQAHTILELARLVGRTLGAEVVVERRLDPARSAGRYVPCTSRARGELGLEERVGLEESIHRTAGWHRAGAGGTLG